VFVTGGVPSHVPIDTQIASSVGFLLTGLIVHLLAATLLRQAKTQARDSVLSRAGSALVAARDRQDVYLAVDEALVGLALEVPEAQFRLLVGGVELMEVVAAAGAGAEDVRGSRFDGHELLGSAAAAVRRGRPTRFEPPAASVKALALPTGTDRALAMPLMARGDIKGVLVVATRGPLPEGAAEALDRLAAETALSLEGVGLTEQFRSLVQNSSDVYSVVSADGTIQYQSPAVERVFGHPAARVVGRNVDRLVHGDDAPRLRSVLVEAAAAPGAVLNVEVRWRHGDGSWRNAEIVVTNLQDDPAVRGMVLNVRDVSERKRLEEELQHRALHDPLTDLANRSLFRESAGRSMARASREGKSVAVLFLDVDEFKHVNDSLGHGAGDRMLQAIAERLRSSIRAYDVAARLGGDEFGVLLEEADERVAKAVADRVMKSMERPILLVGHQMTVGVSLGIAVSEPEHTDVDELLRNADAAMYMAKSRGKGRYEFFEPTMHTSARERLEAVGELRKAMDEQQFVLHYQPIVSLSDGTLTGVEALLRWEHPTRGTVQPMEFIPLAEETGMIVPIGRWVLEEACSQMSQWDRRVSRAPEMTMSVNVSVRQLQEPDFVSDVEAALRAANLEPSRLTLEITETVLIRDVQQSLTRMEELHELGVQLAVDDFGTGYASLGYLARFPIDILKIDRTFISGSGSGSDLTPVMVSIGQTLGLHTLAEGVEHPEQVGQLRKLGFDSAQGFLFSKPASAEEIERLLDVRPTTAADLETRAAGM
ncbi:MAG TPA: EAL domain-containing protein, partial [Actinomycetota bacterium]|nr:EAL domain-containing protein [Actinomycetota bacterium]